jgi:23S rRNA (guanosine2251-2'-O)-methyltransferase
LSDLTQLKEFLYGRQAVRETLKAGRRRIYKLILAEGVQETGIIAEIVALARAQGIPVERSERRQLDQRGGAGHHQGVGVEASPYPYVEPDDLLAEAGRWGEPPFLLILDCLQDPQNFGTLLRAAEATGVHGVIIPKRRAVGVTPAAVNASAGGVEHLLVAQVTNLVRTMVELKRRGVWLVGLEASPEARELTAVDLDMPLALVVGSEGRGLGRLVRETCDLLVRLPMRGHLSSLNAAVAGAVALYAAWGARGYPARPQEGERPAS